MTDSKNYLIEQLKTHGLIYQTIIPVRAEASTRSFFRIIIKDENQSSRSSSSAFTSLIAMVYPEPAQEDLERIIRFTDLYKRHGLNVPNIKERICNRILLQEDLGDMLFQRYYSRSKSRGGLREHILDQTAEIVIKLQHIPAENTAAVLDTARMKWELDFFLTHFAAVYLDDGQGEVKAADFRQRLHHLVSCIQPVDTFAHRDFHSRNMLIYKNEIYLVDFQDSLIAPRYYDLVSFVYDAYLDIGVRRSYLLKRLEASGLAIDEEQFYLTALQRNIKALGTFGFQVNQRQHLTYKRYIPRTLRYIRHNPLYDRFFTSNNFNLT